MAAAAALLGRTTDVVGAVAALAAVVARAPALAFQGPQSGVTLAAVFRGRFAESMRRVTRRALVSRLRRAEGRRGGHLGLFLLVLLALVTLLAGGSLFGAGVRVAVAIGAGVGRLGVVVSSHVRGLNGFVTLRAAFGFNRRRLVRLVACQAIGGGVGCARWSELRVRGTGLMALPAVFEAGFGSGVYFSFGSLEHVAGDAARLPVHFRQVRGWLRCLPLAVLDPHLLGVALGARFCARVSEALVESVAGHTFEALLCDVNLVPR